MESVSVIVNSYRDTKEWFNIGIPSVLNQKRVNIHLILSTVEGDPCIEWIKDYKGDIEVVTMEDHGDKDPANSFRQLLNAIGSIKHEWTFFASANDQLMLDKSINELKALSGTNKLVCYSARYDADVNLNIINTVRFPRKYNYNQHLQGNFVSDISMVQSKAFMEFMPFSDLYNCGYWDLWLRMYEKLGNVFVYNPRPVTKYVQGDDAMHIKRQHDPKKKARFERDIATMLRSHTK